LDEVQRSTVCRTISNVRNFETSIPIGHGHRPCPMRNQKIRINLSGLDVCRDTPERRVLVTAIHSKQLFLTILTVILLGSSSRSQLSTFKATPVIVNGPSK
jgi:hypothetical protein